MSQFIEAFERTFLANEAITQYRLVKVGSGDNSVDMVDAEGDGVVGVARRDADAGQSVRVQFLGTAKVEAGAAITKGAVVVPDASGRVITANTGGTIVGRALEAAGAAGDVIEVQLFISSAVSA